MADFLENLKVLYRLQKELAALQKDSSAAASLANQAIASKQGQITTAEKALQDSA